MNPGLKKIISEYLGEEIKDSEQITEKGIVNNVFIISTDNSKYIVRIDPNEASSSRFEKEAWCTTESEKLGVLGPKVLKIGIEENHPYMLISYIGGTHGEDMTKEAQLHLWEKLGEYAKKIHSTKVTGYGERMIDAGIFDGSWDEYLEYNISSLNADDKLLTMGFITREQSDSIKTNFLKLKETNFNFGLVHHDISLKNTIVSPDEEVYLLDWGSAEVNVIPHMDIGEILRSSLNDDSIEFETFLKGYGLTRDKFKEIKPNILRLRLLMSSDKVRWALDRKPELVEQKVQELQDTLVLFKA